MQTGSSEPFPFYQLPLETRGEIVQRLDDLSAALLSFTDKFNAFNNVFLIKKRKKTENLIIDALNGSLVSLGRELMAWLSFVDANYLFKGLVSSRLAQEPFLFYLYQHGAYSFAPKFKSATMDLVYEMGDRRGVELVHFLREKNLFSPDIDLPLSFYSGRHMNDANYIQRFKEEYMNARSSRKANPLRAAVNAASARADLVLLETLCSSLDHSCLSFIVSKCLPIENDLSLLKWLQGKCTLDDVDLPDLLEVAARKGPECFSLLCSISGPRHLQILKGRLLNPSKVIVDIIERMSEPAGQRDMVDQLILYGAAESGNVDVARRILSSPKFAISELRYGISVIFTKEMIDLVSERDPELFFSAFNPALRLMMQRKDIRSFEYAFSKLKTRPGIFGNDKNAQFEVAEYIKEALLSDSSYAFCEVILEAFPTLQLDTLLWSMADSFNSSDFRLTQIRYVLNKFPNAPQDHLKSLGDLLKDCTKKEKLQHGELERLFPELLPTTK